MKTKYVIISMALFLMACGAAPEAETTESAPVDTINNAYDKQEVQEIRRDTLALPE